MLTTDLGPVLTTDQHGNPAVNVPAARAEYLFALTGLLDQWVVGGAGLEVPSRSRLGRWTLHMWNPGQGRHGTLDLATDVVTAENTLPDWDNVG